MTIDDLAKTTGEWLRGAGANADVVISSRVRLARNLADYPFLSTAGEDERTEVYRALADAISANADWAGSIFVDLLDADPLDRRFLVERHLISRQHENGKGCRGVSVSPDERRSLMVNEEDHLRMQVLRSGFELDGLLQEVIDVDDALSETLPFAFDAQFGYLTACPTNVGTGIRVSVMLHLPALKLTKELERVARAAADLRLAIRGLYGEGTDAVGDFYQVSNQTTLGKSEEEIISSFGLAVIPKIVEYERAARESLAKHRPYQLDDRIGRAYGTLCHARCLSSEELHALLSPIRMGIHMGRFDRFGVDVLNELFLYTQSAHLQKRCGETLEGIQRAIARAEYVRGRLAS